MSEVTMYNFKGGSIKCMAHQVDRMLELGWSCTPPGHTEPDLRTTKLVQAIAVMDERGKDDAYREQYFTKTGLPDLDKLKEEVQALYPDEDFGTVTAGDRQRALMVK